MIQLEDIVKISEKLAEDITGVFKEDLDDPSPEMLNSIQQLIQTRILQEFNRADFEREKSNANVTDPSPTWADVAAAVRLGIYDAAEEQISFMHRTMCTITGKEIKKPERDTIEVFAIKSIAKVLHHMQFLRDKKRGGKASNGTTPG